MRTCVIIFVCALVVNAHNFNKIYPIERLLAQYPDKYPLFNELFNRTESKIVGGNEATNGQFPFMAALFIELQGQTFFCGGSLISDEYVLTAAHCADMAESIEVVLGAHDVLENEASQLKIVVPPENIIVHENWSSFLVRNDIALLKLPKTINFNDRIQAINLPRQIDRDNTFAGQSCTTSGWGVDKDSSSSYSSVLRFIETEVLTNDACKSYYPSALIDSSKICASGKGGKSSCSGDSGSPLTVLDGGQPLQIGVVSFGIAIKCEIGYPHGYTRITEYLDWIKDNSNIVIQP